MPKLLVRAPADKASHPQSAPALERFVPPQMLDELRQFDKTGGSSARVPSDEDIRQMKKQTDQMRTNVSTFRQSTVTS